MPITDDLIKFQGDKFSVEFSGQLVPGTENEPWPKTIQSVTVVNCDPNLTDTQTLMQCSFEKQGCSQVAKFVRRKLWIAFVKHVVSVFEIKPEELFKE